MSNKQQEWTERLARYEQANLTVLEFCATEGVSPANFYLWKRRLASTPKPTPKLVPIQLTPPTPPNTIALELVLPSGAVLRFPPTSTPSQVVAIVQALEAGPC